MLVDPASPLTLEATLAQVDQIASSLAWWDGRAERRQRLLEAGFEPDNPVVRRLLALVETLIGFPRHLSQHVGGFIIDNRKLTRLVPIENAAMPSPSVYSCDVGVQLTVNPSPATVPSGRSLKVSV